MLDLWNSERERIDECAVAASIQVVLGESQIGARGLVGQVWYLIALYISKAYGASTLDSGSGME